VEIFTSYSRGSVSVLLRGMKWSDLGSGLSLRNSCANLPLQVSESGCRSMCNSRSAVFCRCRKLSSNATLVSGTDGVSIPVQIIKHSIGKACIDYQVIHHADDVCENVGFVSSRSDDHDPRSVLLP
jgi:hypothetical protein